MFRDAQGLLFTQDGVCPDMVRAGEPHLDAQRSLPGSTAAPARSRRRLPLLRWGRPVTS